MTGDRDGMRLAVFGAPSLYDRTGRRISIGARATALLTILAVEPEPQSRVWIAKLLWSDRQAGQARASLRQCLVELRHALARHGLDFPIVADAREIRLLPDRLSTDVAHILSACAGRDRTALAKALDEAAARPLVSDLEPSSEFVDWVVATRRRIDGALDEALAEMLTRRAGTADDLDWEVSATLARARLAHDPSCPLATAVLRGRPPPWQESPQRSPLLPLPLPADAPPAVYVPIFGHGDLEYEASLASALRDEIVSALSRFQEVRVVVLDGDHAFYRQSEHEVGYRLSVTLRTTSPREGTVSARLETTSDQVLWGSRFPLVVDHFHAAIDGIVEQIAAAVAPTVERHLAGAAPHRPDGTLYERYLSARIRSMRPPDHAAARRVANELEDIVAQAPRFAPPKLALARLYNTDFAWTLAMSSGEAERVRALMLARSAVATDRGHVHGHSLLGWCHLRQQEWGAARRCFDEATRLNPYHAERLMEVAYGLIHLGDLEAGEALLRRCMAINPVSSDGFHFDLGVLALVRGDPILSSEHLSMIADPDCWGSIAKALADVQAHIPADSAIQAARDAIAAIWPTGRLPPLPSLRDWVASRHPFRLPQHLSLFIAGLDKIAG